MCESKLFMVVSKYRYKPSFKFSPCSWRRILDTPRFAGANGNDRMPVGLESPEGRSHAPS